MSSSSFQPTGDTVDGVRSPAVIASVLLSGDHFASITFWTGGMSTRPVQLSPGSHSPAASSGSCVALRVSAGIHAPRTSESIARASFALIAEILGVGHRGPTGTLGQCNDIETEISPISFATRSSGSGRDLVVVGLRHPDPAGRPVQRRRPGRLH